MPISVGILSPSHSILNGSNQVNCCFPAEPGIYVFSALSAICHLSFKSWSIFQDLHWWVQEILTFFLMYVTSLRCSFACSNTSSFFLAVHGRWSILSKNHISVAFILDPKCLCHTCCHEFATALCHWLSFAWLEIVHTFCHTLSHHTVSNDFHQLVMNFRSQHLPRIQKSYHSTKTALVHTPSSTDGYRLYGVAQVLPSGVGCNRRIWKIMQPHPSVWHHF